MNDKLVSVIVPIYNSESTIEDCLESILNQSYKNLEIIAVDDGSSDKSVDVVNRFKDCRIKLFSKENGGVSSARNLGIEKSSGEYISFVDSDDKLVEDSIEILTRDANNIDLIIGNTFVKESGKTYSLKHFTGLERIEKLDVIKEVLFNGAGLVCSKFIRKKVLEENNIRFDEKIIFGEDQLFFLDVTIKSNSYKYKNEDVYFYNRVSESSTINSYNKNLVGNFIDLNEKIIRRINSLDLDKEEKCKITNRKIKHFFWDSIFNENILYKKKISSLNEFIKSINKITHEIEPLLNMRYKEIEGRADKVMYKIIKKNNYYNALNLIFYLKILNLIQTK